jgi:hypothetical protein
MITNVSVLNKNKSTVIDKVRESLDLGNNISVEYDITNEKEVILKLKEHDCEAFFKRLDKINKEMDEGDEVTFDVDAELITCEL